MHNWNVFKEEKSFHSVSTQVDKIILDPKKRNEAEISIKISPEPESMKYIDNPFEKVLENGSFSKSLLCAPFTPGPSESKSVRWIVAPC